MIPRGEVGLIFAQMGLATGALTSQLYSAVAMMVLATTLITPPLLALMLRGEGTGAGAVSADRPGEGGIDDLVAGASHAETMLPPETSGTGEGLPPRAS